MLLYYLLTVVSCFLSGSLSQPDFMHQWCYNYNNNSGYNYTTNSTYQRNLETLLSSSSQIPSKAVNNSGFSNLSVGLDPNQVNSLALCRGDASSDVCRSCLTNATNKIEKTCPNSVEAIGVYDYCQLRYSNRTIYGVEEENPYFITWTEQDASNVTAFNEALQKLLERLKSAAVSSNNIRKFAIGNETAEFFVTIYGMLQCSRDLSDLDCENCLTKSIAGIPGCCGSNNTRVSYRIIKPSCYMRYDTSQFYEITAPPPPSSSPPPLTDSPPTTSEKGNGGDDGKNVVVIIVPIVTSIVLVLAVCIFFLLSRQKKKPMEDVKNELESVQIDSLRFDLATIKDATSNFSQENKLGQGGFGAVYKGTLHNGTEIAVKRLSKGSLQGVLEFKNEVLLLAKLQHRNLVRLLGFCLDRNERLLIYEFVVNSSLDHFIFDPEKRKLLDWTRRYKIIIGIARGLQYLHVDSRLRVIHRDLKASNILLDAEMNPKISDFGLAKLFAIDQSEGNTSKIAGTYGYMSPEYAAFGQFSIKSDVFSFGVLLLEILSGRKNLYFQRGEKADDLLSYTWKNWSKGTPLNVVDPTLSTGSDIEKMRCIHIGLLCVQENVGDRPDMSSIALMLNDSSHSLARPAQPAFFLSTITRSLEPRPFTLDHDSQVSSTSKSNEQALPLSRNEASITELSPR